MKYKVGDRVKLVDSYPTVCFKDWLGKVVTIDTAKDGFYTTLEICSYFLTEDMIEGLVEEETKPNIIEEAKTYWDSIKDAWICPEGYQFVDENGNVINATKIVLEKKKKEYPKTYAECYQITGLLKTSDIYGYKNGLLFEFQKLLIARDAYWKIAGDEMGLGKPWEPNDADYVTGRYCIFVYQGNIICSTPAEDCPFTFPTEEIRDAFYENFKELIEQCKELL